MVHTCLDLIVILSGGQTPLIITLLTAAIGPKLPGNETIANTVAARHDFESVNDPGAAWQAQFVDDSFYGHDKASTILPYAKHRESLPDGRPILLYASDGVSDISAANETNLSFAKQNEGLDFVRGMFRPFP
ncbi:phosphoserine phosphatase [Paramyrothecium foliicola]|nr:phosphoserine phosphatase [Paramyrothecium foliicola]